MLTVITLPGIKAIKPRIGVVDSSSELLNISSHFSCSRRIAATSLCGKTAKLESNSCKHNGVAKLGYTVITYVCL